MPALKKLLTHEVTAGNNTFKLPPKIIKSANNNSEINKVVDSNGRVLWGKYKILMEDDYADAYELDEINYDPQSYSSLWEEYRHEWIKTFSLEFIGGGNDITDEAYFAAFGVRSARPVAEFFSGIGNGLAYFSSSTESQLVANPSADGTRSYGRGYHGESLNAYLQLRPGFYNTNWYSSTSWGGNGGSVLLSSGLTSDYVIGCDIRASLGVRPKYGYLDLTTPSSLNVSLYRMHSYEALESAEASYSDLAYAVVPLGNTAKIYTGDKLYYGDELQMIASVNSTHATALDYLKLPQAGIAYTFKLDNRDREANEFHYLNSPGQTISLEIPHSFAIYPDSGLEWYESSGTFYNGVQTTYGLRSTTIFFNPLFDLNKYPITFIASRSNIYLYGASEHLYITQSNVNNNIPNSSFSYGWTTFWQYKINPSFIADLTSSGDPTPWNSENIHPGPRTITIAADDKYIDWTIGSGTTMPLSMPSYCEIIYTYSAGGNNKLVKLDLLDGTTSEIKPTITLVNANSQYIEHSEDGSNLNMTVPEAKIYLPLYTSDIVEISYWVSWDCDSGGGIIYTGGTAATAKTYNLVNSGTHISPTITISPENIWEEDVSSGEFNALSSGQQLLCTLNLVISIPNRGITWQSSFDYTISTCYYTEGTGESYDCF